MDRSVGGRGVARLGLPVRDVSTLPRVISDPRGWPLTGAERSYRAARRSDVYRTTRRGRRRRRPFDAVAACRPAPGDDMKYIGEHFARRPPIIAPDDSLSVRR